MSDSALGHYKTRPTNMKRVREIGEVKAQKGMHGFHAPAICFHPRYTSRTELEKIMKDICNGTANETINRLYLLAENHNVLSSKHAADICVKNGELAKRDAYFASFEAYVLAFPKREAGTTDDQWLNLCKQIFRYVS